MLNCKALYASASDRYQSLVKRYLLVRDGGPSASQREASGLELARHEAASTTCSCEPGDMGRYCRCCAATG